MTFMMEAQPQGGLGFGTQRVLAFNRTGGALVIGTLVEFDIHRNQAETTSILEGGDASVFANVAPSTAGGSVAYGLYGVTLTPAADNAQVEVLVQGKVRCRVDATTAGFPVGARLRISGTVGGLGDTGASGHKSLALLLEAHTGAPTSQQRLVLFDGIHGFK